MITLDTKKYQLGYVALGVFLMLLVLVVSNYGQPVCNEPHIQGAWETVVVFYAFIGIWSLGVAWGQRKTAMLDTNH